MASFAFTSTKWAMRFAEKLTKADVRLHNAEVIEDDMSVLFVVNHFTRVETFLLPYMFYKNFGKQVWSLGASELFTGRIGAYLRKIGTISTKDPDRDKVIVHSLLKGDHPWIIFPEGQMIKDKKVIDPAGLFSVYNRGERRPPHRGAAHLALRAEFFRHKLDCIYKRPGQAGLQATEALFDLDTDSDMTVEDVLAKRTVIVPVNITYFPIRARDNAILRMASVLAKDLSDRALEELSVEGTLLSSDTDIDITLGEPIDVRAYLQRPEYGELMACGDDLLKLETDPKSLFSEAADHLMLRYMENIYRLTRINYDHIFATLIRYQPLEPFTERRYRNRIFLCAHQLIKEGKHRMHSLLRSSYYKIIYEDRSPKFHDFMALCLKEKIIERRGSFYVRVPDPDRGQTDFHAVRSLETTYVIANEAEPLAGFTDMVKAITATPREELSRRIRTIFLDEDNRIFNEDYQEYASDESHSMDVGRPFLLVPESYRAGVVLIHGYLSAPKEVRNLANFLYHRGYAVYGVRLKGHGTSPEDLARTKWEEWYESVNHGYSVIKSLTDRIVLGGFSTGGGLALMGAGLKGDKIQAVFSVNAPLKLRQIMTKLVPSVVGINALLKKLKGSPTGWEYVQNSPENEHINYKRNPLAGVHELGAAMDRMEECLADIIAPTLVVQGASDPIVEPSSGLDIFSRVGTTDKELLMLERDNHGIVNGTQCEDVFERVYQFLLWAEGKSRYRDLPDEVLEGKPVLAAHSSRSN